MTMLLRLAPFVSAVNLGALLIAVPLNVLFERAGRARRTVAKTPPEFR